MCERIAIPRDLAEESIESLIAHSILENLPVDFFQDERRAPTGDHSFAVSLVIDGVPCSFRNILKEVFEGEDERVRAKAKEMLNERMSDFLDSVDSLHVQAKRELERFSYPRCFVIQDEAGVVQSVFGEFEMVDTFVSKREDESTRWIVFQQYRRHEVVICRKYAEWDHEKEEWEFDGE